MGVAKSAHVCNNDGACTCGYMPVTMGCFSFSRQGSVSVLPCLGSKDPGTIGTRCHASSE